MTLSESPPTPLTASSTIGTIDFNDDDEYDVIGGNLATGAGCNDSQGGDTRTSSCALTSSDRSTEKNTNSSDSSSFTDSSRKEACVVDIGENVDHESSSSAIASDVNSAGKPIFSSSTSGWAPPVSPVEGRSASTVETAGVPLSEALEGAERRRFGSKSKQSVFYETSNNLLSLAAAYGEQEGVSDEQGGENRILYYIFIFKQGGRSRINPCAIYVHSRLEGIYDMGISNLYFASDVGSYLVLVFVVSLRLSQAQEGALYCLKFRVRALYL